MEINKLMNEIKKNPHFEILQNGKIHCKLTKHDLVPDLTILKDYIQGKSYRIAVEKNHDFTQYEPYLVLYKKDDKYLWCNVTKTKLIKLKSIVERHVNGKRFLRLKKNYDEKIKKENEKLAMKEQIKAQKKKKFEEKNKQKNRNEEEEDDDDFDVEAMDAMLQNEEDDSEIEEGDSEIEEDDLNDHEEDNQIEDSDQNEENDEDYEDIEENSHNDQEDNEDDESESSVKKKQQKQNKIPNLGKKSKKIHKKTKNMLKMKNRK